MRIRTATRQQLTATGMALATALTGSIAPLALAQDPPITDTDAVPGNAIIITGSNIPRSDYEGPQSVIIYDQKRIQQSGAQTVTEILKRLPQNTGGFTDLVNIGFSFSPGASAASLRGLGVSATLVLINGRRVAPFPLAQDGVESFVDLNSVPLSAIERIEILKEGATAIYGSDAIAGVVNIILKTNYSGAEIETYIGNTTDTDSLELRESLTTGFANEKLRLMVTTNYYHSNALSNVNRGFAETADHTRQGGDDLRSVRSNPGTFFFSGSAAFPNGAVAVPRGGNGRTNVPGFNPDTYFVPGFLPDGNFTNRFNFNKYTDLIPETERWGGFATFGYTIFGGTEKTSIADGKMAKAIVPSQTPRLEVFGEVSYQAVKTYTEIAPTPPDSAGDPLFVPATNPFNPFGEDLFFLWRAVEVGPRKSRTETDAYRGLGGLRLSDLPKNWSVETAFLYSETNVVDYSYAGFLSVEKVQAALNDTNPSTSLNVFGDGQGINNNNTLKNLVARPRNDGIAYTYGQDLKATGELFDLPAGPVKMAIGGEYREEALSQSVSAPAGSIVSFAGHGSGGDRDVRSLFYEVSIPITSDKWNTPGVRSLEFSIAQRYDDYSDFGDTAKPKFGFAWKPVKGLLFRGAYSEGFRAPSLPQLFTNQVVAIDEGPFIGRSSIAITTGGNPNLQPETSYGYFLGFVADPPFVPGLSIAVDFYRIEQRNLIDQPSANFIVNNFPKRVTYDANGQITAIDLTYINLGTVVVDGVDLELTYKLETGIGTFTLESRFAYIQSFEQVLVPGDPNDDISDSFQLPEFKMVNSLFWEKSGWELGVTVNYIDSYDDIVYDESLPPRQVGSFTTVDLQASYEFNFVADDVPGGYSKDGKTSREVVPGTLTGWKKWLNGTKVTVGCLNVGDCEPPFSNIVEGYDTATGDPTGRFVYASVRKKFW